MGARRVTVKRPCIRARRSPIVPFGASESSEGRPGAMILIGLIEPSTMEVHGRVECRERLGGVLKYYYRRAA